MSLKSLFSLGNRIIEVRKVQTEAAHKHAQGGYSLLEILVVLAIISALMAIVGPRVLGHVDQSKVVSTKTQAKNLKDALGIYRLRAGTYPDKTVGLQVLIDPPVGEKILDEDQLPLDAWGNAFHYEPPTVEGGRTTSVKVYSLGADNEPGGEGLNADIYG
jgi:general secretion pathway protein G